MRAKPNQVVVTHLGEPCVYEIDHCELNLTDRGLDLDVFTRPNDACPLAHLGEPTFHIESATVDAYTIEGLTEEYLSVDVGWDTDDERKEDNIFRVCISQHLALDNNRVEMVRNQNDQFEIKWTATAQDFIDFRNPDCTIEVHCVIEL